MMFSVQNCMLILNFSLVHYMTFLFNSQFYHPNNITSRKQIIAVLVTQFSSSFWYLISATKYGEMKYISAGMILLVSRECSADAWNSNVTTRFHLWLLNFKPQLRLRRCLCPRKPHEWFPWNSRKLGISFLCAAIKPPSCWSRNPCRRSYEKACNCNHCKLSSRPTRLILYSLFRYKLDETCIMDP